MGHLQLIRYDPQRVPGAKDSRIRVKCNYKDLNVKILKDDTAEVERMLKVLIKSLENKYLDP